VIAEFQSPGLVARRVGLAAPQAGELWVGNVSLARTAVLPTITRSDTGAAQPGMDIWIGRVGPFGDVVPYGVPDGITIPGRPGAGLLSDALGGVYFPIPDADAGAIFEIEANLQERLTGFQVVAVDVTTSPTVASAVPMLLQQITGGTGCDDLIPSVWYNPDFSVVQGLFNIHCVGCHGHVRPYMGLNLEEGFAFSSLVNRRSREVPSLYLVQERPSGFAASDNQYLLEKITCDAPSIGGVMPPAGKITGQERRDIAQWIRNGSKPSAAPPRRTAIWADTTEGLSPARVQFRGGADAAQPPFTFEWDFGDGSAPITTTDPQRTFVVLSGTNVYTTRVTARNRAGQVVGTASWNLSITAPEPTPGNVPPTAQLAASDVTTVGAPFLLSAAGSIDPDGQVMAYLWDLDADGQWDTTTATPELQHTINRGGGHRVRVGAVDNHNAVGTAEVIVVLPTEIDAQGMWVF
jgi:PKD repeat protein